MKMGMYPPAIIVHGLNQARRALAPRRPVLLLSAPGAGMYAGVGWWQALMLLARDAAPEAPFEHMLDCGDAAGRALEALRIGQTFLVLDCAGPVWADVAARACGLGATLLRTAPPALDLARPGADRDIAAWLG
jgi:hypothetical protein